MKRARQSIGLTQGDFAEQVGVKKSTVSRWESGGLKPSYESLKRLCAYLLNIVILNDYSRDAKDR